MGIRDKENELFDNLKQFNPDIVIDGIIDEASYSDARYKIIFILKEVNGGKGWDLREYVYSGGRPQTWNNIARWTEAVLGWEKDFTWSQMETNNEERRNVQLKMIGAVNIKKTSGGYVSNEKEIYEAGELNSEILRAQIKLYDADYIILCGTEGAFVSSYYKNKAIDWKMTKRGIRYFCDDRCKIVSFCHPEARIGDNYMFYMLADAIKEINTTL